MDASWARSFDKKTVVAGKRINLKEMRRLGLNLMKEVKFQGWMHFFKLKEFVYPNTIKTFLKSAKVVGQTIVEAVGEKEIIISLDCLQFMTEAKDEGLKRYNNFKWLDNDDELELMRFL